MYDGFFKGKVALVTGGAMGMGLAAVSAFAEAGAAVVLSDVDDTVGLEATNTLVAQGHDVTFIHCDVSHEAEVKSLVEVTVEKYGHLDAAFNNAGIITLPMELPEVSNEDYERTMSINLDGVWYCMKYELQQMHKQGSGAIVNNSSLGGLVANPGRAAYHAAKHGVLGMTKCAGVENAARGIQVNAVCPGTIDTPMVRALMERENLSEEFFSEKQPIMRLGRPEEVAAAVLWLCSPGASLVVGHGLPVDGGYTIL
jgi:NAD(P)-dependent dehydrogenase (short-subunit alcohol dehydrogenase family)